MGNKLPSLTRLSLKINIKKLIDVANNNSNIVDKEKNKLNLKYAIKQKVLAEHLLNTFDTRDDMYKFANFIVDYYINRGGNPFLILQALH